MRDATSCRIEHITWAADDAGYRTELEYALATGVRLAAAIFGPSVTGVEAQRTAATRRAVVASHRQGTARRRHLPVIRGRLRPASMVLGGAVGRDEPTAEARDRIARKIHQHAKDKARETMRWAPLFPIRSRN